MSQLCCAAIMIFALHSFIECRRVICGFLFYRFRPDTLRRYTILNITSKTIIDAHMHLPAVPSALEEKKRILLEEMADNGVAGGIVISDSESESCIGTLTECSGLFDGCGTVRVVGGISPFIEYERQLSLLDDLLARQKAAGIKLYCGHEPFFLNDPVLHPVFELARRHRTPVLFHSGWDEPQYTAPEVIKQTADLFPDVTFVCCHCCYPRIAECFDTLSACSNVYFDLSSVADGSDLSLLPTLEQAINAMPTRFIFGSDYGCCNQAAHIDFFRKLRISPEKQSLLFYRNACRIYGLSI